MFCLKNLLLAARLALACCRSGVRLLLALALVSVASMATAQPADYSYEMRIVRANAPFFTELTDVDTMTPGDKAWLQLKIISAGGESHGAVQLVGALPSPLRVGSTEDTYNSCTYYLNISQEGDEEFNIGTGQWGQQTECTMMVPIVWPADVPCAVSRTLTINASKDNAANPVVASDSLRCVADVAVPAVARPVPTLSPLALALMAAVLGGLGVVVRRRGKGATR